MGLKNLKAKASAGLKNFKEGASTNLNFLKEESSTRLKVGHESFTQGQWQHMQLVNNNADHLKAIVVGNQDFVMTGTQRQIVKWLTEFDRPIKCSAGFGNEVWIIFRERAPKISEEMQKAYGAALGVSGVGSLIFHGVGAFSASANTAFQAAASGDAASTVAGAAFNMSDINLDSMLGKVVDKLIAPKVQVRLSCARGAYSSQLSKSSIVKIPSNLTSKYCAGVLAIMKW